MTYNIHHGRGMDGRLDLERLAAVIRDAGVDIVALQEVDVGVERSQRRDLVAELADLTGLRFTAFGKNIDFQGGDYGNAILSAWPVFDDRNTHLNDGSSERRGAQELRIARGRDTLVVVNTHLDHSPDPAARLAAIDQITREVLARHTTNCLIMAGDFNDTPESQAIQVVSAHLEDAWSAAGIGDGYTFPADHPSRRIDYIFHGAALHPLEARVLPTEASDHRPVVVEFEGCR
jgi:endonuclease/exonuclease/phosphatase family metal-dependent hydrolase